jgi:hypothetical protein
MTGRNYVLCKFKKDNGFQKRTIRMSAYFERRKDFRHEIFETRVIEHALGISDGETLEGLALNIKEAG